MNFKKLLETAICASLEAGKDIMKIYNTADFGIQIKNDNSPLTLADEKAHETIISYLSDTNIPILSEEGSKEPYQSRKDWEYFWLVDPLDGTKEFIKQNNEFTVNIALIHNGVPVMGIIYVPVSNELYYASEQIGTYKTKNIPNGCSNTILLDKLILSSIKLPINNLKNTYTIVGSRSHMSDETVKYIEKLKQKHGDIEIISKGSSLKLCMVAEGRADIYPRFGPTMEWDTAAGHAIVLNAGFSVTKTDEITLLVYNKENLLNPWFIVK